MAHITGFLFFLISTGSSATDYSSPFSTIIKAVDEMDSLPKDQQLGEAVAEPSFSPQLNSGSNDIFRSMKINDTSKTPYSDATQVR